MGTVRLEGASRTIEIVTTSNVDTDNDQIAKLNTAIGDLFDAVDLQWFRVTPTEAPNEWRYRFKHVDGRNWNQFIRLGPPVTMDFNTDFWELEAFVPHRPVRDLVVAMLASGLVSIDVATV